MLHVQPRTAFILRRGIVPWGIAVGAVVALLVGWDARRSPPSGPPLGTGNIIAIEILSFLVWSWLVGWVIGGIRWAVRDVPGALVPPPRSLPHDRHDEDQSRPRSSDHVDRTRHESEHRATVDRKKGG